MYMYNNYVVLGVTSWFEEQCLVHNMHVELVCSLIIRLLQKWSLTGIDIHVFQFQWKQFMELGRDIETSVIEDIMQKQKPSQCATLVYTVMFCSLVVYIRMGNKVDPHCIETLLLYV